MNLKLAGLVGDVFEPLLIAFVHFDIVHRILQQS